LAILAIAGLLVHILSSEITIVIIPAWYLKLNNKQKPENGKFKLVRFQKFLKPYIPPFTA